MGSTKTALESKPKRKANSLNSSDDEKESLKKEDHKKKRRIIDSDDEEEKPKLHNGNIKKKASPVKDKKKRVEVDVMSMFGSEPVKRKERPKIAKKSPNVSSGVIDLDDDDVDFDVSLVDDIEKQETVKQAQKNDKKKETIVEKKSPIKVDVKDEKKTPVKRMALPNVKKEENSAEKNPRQLSRSPSPKKAKVLESTSAKKLKVVESTSAKKAKKSKEPKVTTAEEDEARHERRQMTAMLYQKYKNRSSVINHGCKEIPKGKPDCLKGLQFVISGILESMERDEAVDLIKSCGGNVVSALSKKVTHLLVGEEAGPKKTEQAKQMKIVQITEDELLSMIRKKSGLPEPDTVEVEVEAVIKDSPGKENRKKNEKAESPKATPKSPDKKKSAAQLSSQAAPKIVTQSEPPAAPASIPQNLDHFSFVDKYKPTSIKQIIGQQGPSGNATKLMNWLLKWHNNHDGKKKHAKPNPWAKDNDGSAYKAALLSGSPGVGKTTTAHLVCKELNFDIVEFNASDTRSKKLLKEEVSSLLSNNSLAGYLNGTETKVSKRHVLIMDEVDGMAGNEDRGGIAELIALIKDSHVPIICMCNDRNHQKIRSLSNHCFDLRFHKPSIQQVRGAMMSICFKEGIKLEAGAIDEIISGTGNDIRQTLNHLALYSASKDVKLATSDAKKNAQMSEKDIKIVS